jgi:hypothetical protein
MQPHDNPLPSWNDTPTRRAIVAFVEAATGADGPGYLPPEERIAVFDNDGTLWCEKPIPIELGFILERLAAMAAQDPALRERQPWKAAYTKDYAWLGEVITKHYQGDDSDVKVLMVGILQAFAGWTVNRYQAEAGTFLHGGSHPTLGRVMCECTYLPMVELLRYLAANAFTTFIASGGDRDFMRAVTQEIHGIPPERVIGSTNALGYQEDEHGGALVYQATPDVFDDGPAKARAHLEPDRSPPSNGGGQLQRRPTHAAVLRRPRPQHLPPPPAARRRGARVRLRRGRRERAGARQGAGLDSEQHQERLGRRLRHADSHRQPGDAPERVSRAVPSDDPTVAASLSGNPRAGREPTASIPHFAACAPAASGLL